MPGRERNAQPATTPAQPVGIVGQLFIEEEAKSGKSVIFGRSGAVKAPVYLAKEALALLSPAGFDPEKPIRYAFWQD